MQQPEGQRWNGAAQISNEGPGTTAPPLATALACTVWSDQGQLIEKRREASFESIAKKNCKWNFKL